MYSVTPQPCWLSMTFNEFMAKSILRVKKQGLLNYGAFCTVQWLSYSLWRWRFYFENHERKQRRLYPTTSLHFSVDGATVDPGVLLFCNKSYILTFIH